jgi:hypothetical protein
MTETRLFLSPSFFQAREQVLVEHGALVASTFCYESGVAALRIENERGALILLPFQGQQIWSARFNGRELTMRSMFDQPHPTRTYLENYGGFLLHCGMTAMGVPTAADTHPLHGELPNAPYEKAWLVAGEDERGMFLELGGQYRHTVAFSYNYIASPRVRLYAGKATFTAHMSVTNLKNTPMEMLYLAHINFRPAENGWLVYSAPYDRDHVRVRTSIPSHVKPPAGYREFLAELAEDPEKHHVLAPGLAFDPEVVFFIDYATDPEGWAHSLQIHLDGCADYVRHRPDQLNHGVRWICRTPDQDALGLVLPATAEPEGYAAEKAKGNVRTLGPGAVWECEYTMGALTPEETRQVQDLIEKVRGVGSGAEEKSA